MPAISLAHDHPWPQHGRRPRPLARDGNEGRRFRQADHCRRQLLHAVRAGPRPPEGSRPARGAGDRSRPAASPRSSTPSRSMTASPWAMTACSTACPRARSSRTSVEYMANAHCADALVCISNCDKITPGMLMASLRLNIPAVFVSGGPMEAGKYVAARQAQEARPYRRHGRGRRRQDDRRGSRGYRALGLPDLRLVLRHVHGQLHELPDRSARASRFPATARRWPPMPTASACSSRPAT